MHVWVVEFMKDDGGWQPGVAGFSLCEADAEGRRDFMQDSVPKDRRYEYRVREYIPARPDDGPDEEPTG